MRSSISPTYDSGETGPRFWVTATVEGRVIEFQKPLDDPFVRYTVLLGWRALVKSLLLRRSLRVEVCVGADIEMINDVLELDAQRLVPGRTRKALLQEDMTRAGK